MPREWQSCMAVWLSVGGGVTLPQGQSFMAWRSQGRGHSFQPGLPVPGPLVSEITAWLPKAAPWGWCETKQKALLWYWVLRIAVAGLKEVSPMACVP